MTIDEAIKYNQERIADLDFVSKHKMRLYQAGIISKEQHNAEQTAINKDRLSRQLGIEALERNVLLRNAIKNRHARETVYELILNKLPSETEGERCKE